MLDNNWESEMREIQPALGLIFNSERENKRSLEQLRQRQAVICWMLEREPTGIAVNVPTRISRFRAEIGAFWSEPDSRRVLSPVKTMAVEIRFERDECWPDVSNKNELLVELKKLESHRNDLEQVIRLKEPELRAGDTLFSEFEEWNYENSRNQDYHRCLKMLEKTRKALYAGSLFEQLRSANVIDYLYLAVPCGLVSPDELANGWGLLYINPDLTVSEVKKAKAEETTAKGKMHFVQNIATAAMKNVLFSCGVNRLSSGEFFCTRQPRRRNKKL